MKIGLIDVDNMDKLDKCFPNIALMKISAYHKQLGDLVGWYDPFGDKYDIVYVAKVFSFTKDYEYPINADKVIYGGSGYCISLVEGKEVFDKSKDIELPYEIEHIYPDYSLYNETDTAYGFMSRGCPRGCGFCHVKEKEGLCSHKVADLKEFWNGQKNVVLLDPNTFACKEWKLILQQLIDSKAYVDFSQGVDIRLMTEEKAEMLKQVKVKHIHFAWDRYEDKEIIAPKLKQFKDVTGWGRGKVSCYVLVGFDTTMEQNIERIMYLRELNFNPYVMVYNKSSLPRGHELKRLQRWCNNKIIFWSCPTFEEYMKSFK